MNPPAPTRGHGERRTNFVEAYRHQFLGMWFEAFMKAVERGDNNALLSRWQCQQAHRIDQLLGEIFDKFVPPPKPEVLQPPANNGAATPTPARRT